MFSTPSESETVAMLDRAIGLLEEIIQELKATKALLPNELRTAQVKCYSALKKLEAQVREWS